MRRKFPDLISHAILLHRLSLWDCTHLGQSSRSARRITDLHLHGRARRGLRQIAYTIRVGFVPAIDLVRDSIRNNRERRLTESSTPLRFPPTSAPTIFKAKESVGRGRGASHSSAVPAKLVRSGRTARREMINGKGEQMF